MAASGSGNRGEVNFERWKKTIGISDDFPILPRRKLPGLEVRFPRPGRGKARPEASNTFMGHRPTTIRSIQIKLPTPLLHVIVNKGFGCTTMCEIVLNQIQSTAVENKRIPIVVNLEDFLSKSDGRLNLAETIKREVFLCLASGDWEDAIPFDYTSIIGGFEKGLGSISGIDMKSYKLSLYRNTFERTGELGPPFNKPLSEILKALSDVHIFPILLYDIPHDIPPEKISALSEEMKIFRRKEGITDSLISEVFFASREVLDALTTSYPRTPLEVIFEPYNALEFSFIINMHFPPAHVANQQYTTEFTNEIHLPLSDSIDIGAFYRKIVPQGNTQFSLREVTEQIRDEIKTTLDRPFGNWPVPLVPI